MAYTVHCDGVLIYDLRDEELVLIDPKISLEVNKAGSFTFKLPPGHPQYDLPQLMTSCIQVFQDDEEIFNGRPITVTTDFYKRKEIECEGQLAFLNDSIQRPAEYHDISVRGYLETLIEIHNSQVEESKQFEVGIVTVTDSNDSLYRYTNYNSTMDEIKEDLINDLGGYIKVRNVYDTDGTLLHRYLDYVYLADYGNTNTQIVEFGENLVDFSQNMDMTDIATVIIPLGATLEDDSGIEALNERLTIADANDGLDYLINETAVALYGSIVKTVTWENVTTAETLKSKGEAYLTDYQFDSLVLEVKTVDLHYTDEEIETFKLGDQIRVLSKPHGLDKYFPLSKLTIYLNKLSNNTITLGTTVSATLSSKTATLSSDLGATEKKIPSASKLVSQAVDQATALITAKTQGYVVTTGNEILIMDTDDVDTATKLWRWNMNGLGYSSEGYDGTYSLAMTMDGSIVADHITTGVLNVGETLRIQTPETEDGKYLFLLTNDGAQLYNADFTLLNSTTKLVLSPDLGLAIGNTSLIDSDGALDTNNTNLWIDTSGNIHLKGTLEAATGTFSGSLSAATGTFAGELQAATGTFSGDLNAAGGTFSGSLNAATGTFAGELKAATGTFSGSLNAATGTFSGDLNAAGGTFSGNLNAAGGTFSGNLNAAGGTFSGSLNAATGTFSGNISGATGTFTGGLNIGSGNFVVDTSGNLTTAGNVTLGGSITLSGDIQWSASNSPVLVLYNRYSGYTVPTAYSYSSFPSTSNSSTYNYYHRTYRSAYDYYAAYSYDGGSSWTAAIKIRGEDGEDGEDGADGADGDDASVTRANIIAALKTSTSGGDGIYRYTSGGSSYIGVSATYILAGTIDASEIALASTYGGFKQGRGSTGTSTTYGALMYGSSSSYYFFASGSGVRMQASSTSFYCSSSSIVASRSITESSDVTLKNSIDGDLSKYEDFYLALEPVMFKWNDSNSDRYHTGFIAQQVEQALNNNGLTNQDFAGLQIQEIENEDGSKIDRYLLGYSEFISLNTYMIQKLWKRVNELERKVGITA